MRWRPDRILKPRKSSDDGEDRPRKMPGMSAREVELIKRVRFIVALARGLHVYGTPAPRLENAVTDVAATMGLVCNVNSNPTSLFFSFREDGGPETMLSEITRVVRLEPGGRDLNKLSLVDAVAEQVLAGELDVDSGYTRLLEIEAMPGTDPRLLVLSHGLIAGALTVMLASGWADLVAALAIGLIVGLIARYCEKRPNLAPALEAICGLAAALLASAISHWLMPLSVPTVVLASLLVLLPGLALTTAINELATQHLVSGVARFAGAFAVLLKLVFGVMAGTHIAHSLGWVQVAQGVVPMPDWILWPALLAGAFGFAASFGAAWRDYPVVMAAAIGSYAITRFLGTNLGDSVGVFLAAVLACAVGNLYARLFHRPGALVRLPGLILLVPGSVGFRGLTEAFGRDVLVSIDTGITLLGILITLVAGLLFGNLLVPPRRTL